MIYQYKIYWTQSYHGWNDQFDYVGDSLVEANEVILKIMNL